MTSVTVEFIGVGGAARSRLPDVAIEEVVVDLVKEVVVEGVVVKEVIVEEVVVGGPP